MRKNSEKTQHKKKTHYGINILGITPFLSVGNVRWDNLLWIFIVQKPVW